MKRRLHIAGWATLIAFPLLGAGILYIAGLPVMDTMFRTELNFILQIGLGGAIGTVLGLGAKWVVTRKVLEPVATRYSRLMAGLGLNQGHVYFLSFCAGFGEELLFRGAIQPLAGIWITAIIFVAIHGYLNPMNWRLSLYGIYMTLAIALLGYLTEWWGIWAAASAHMAIDVVLFNFLSVYAKRETPSLEPFSEKMEAIHETTNLHVENNTNLR